MIELDRDVAAVWQSTLNGQAQWLSDRITQFKFSKASVTDQLSGTTKSLRRKAWKTLLRNRVSYGGIITRRSGLLKKGERGNGLRSRWYPETLAGRIEAINKLKTKIDFIYGDGLAWLKKHAAQSPKGSKAYFIDPPYIKAGKRLYTENTLDHEQLFEVASRLPGRVLMTYDDTSEVRRLAIKYGFSIRKVSMISRAHHNKTELLIAKEFSWHRKTSRKHRSTPTGPFSDHKTNARAKSKKPNR